MTRALDDRLRTFVAEHLDGWDHGAWENLLAELGERGISVPDEQVVGHKLESERTRMTLAHLGVKGLGPKRREAIAAAYPRLWDLRQVGVDELARLPTIPAQVAEDVVRALH